MMQFENLSVIILIMVMLYLFYRLLPQKGNNEFSNDFINFDFSKNLTEKDLAFEIFSSSNQNEIMKCRIILDSNDIKYCILNSVFHDLYPGPYIWGYNVSRFYVTQDNYEVAYSLLLDYKNSIMELDKVPNKKRKFQHILEVLVLGWIIHDKSFKGNTYLAKHKDIIT